MAFNRDKALSNAQKHIRKSNWDKAIREYRKIVEHDPSDMRSHLKLADLLVKNEEEDEAFTAYQTVAYHYLNDQVYDKSVAVFKQALRLRPDHADLHRDLGEAYHRLGRLKEALREFHHAQRIYREKKESRSQRDILERMVRIEPEDIGLRIQLAERYAKDDMKDQAVELLRFAAEKLEDEGRHDEFLQVSERLIYLDPGELGLRNKVIRIYDQRGDYKRALRHLQVCFRENAKDVQTLTLLSHAFMELDKSDKALLVYRELARVFVERKQKERARETYETILEIHPKDREARDYIKSLEPSVVDSDSLPGLYDTGVPQQGNALRSTAPPADSDAQDELPEVEFLDEDLIEELAPVAAPASKAPPVPEKEQVSDDLMAFAEDTLEEVGDIDFGSIQSLPGEKSPAVPPIPGKSSGSTDVEIDQRLKETAAFFKLGLYDKVREVLYALVEEAPDHLGVREQLKVFYELRREYERAAEQLIEMARITRTTPLRAANYLETAAEYMGDRGKVEKIAQQLDIDFDVEEEDLPELSEISLITPDAIEPISSSGIDPISNVSGAFASISKSQQKKQPSEEEEDGVAPSLDIDLDDEELLEIDISEVGEEMFDADELGGADLIMNIDTDSVVEIDEEETSWVAKGEELEEEEYEMKTSPEIDIASIKADANRMFDELFDESASNKTSSSSLGASTIGRDSTLGEIAELDFLLEEGLLDEASEVLDSIEMKHPEHPAVQERRFRFDSLSFASDSEEIETLSAAPQEGQSFAGDRSLSQVFRPNSLDSDSMFSRIDPNSSLAGIMSVGEVMNTNFELGAAYLEMGLFDEALEEFRQAVDDPEVAQRAQYNIAMCEVKLGRTESAKARLAGLLRDGGGLEQVRRNAHKLLQKIS